MFMVLRYRCLSQEADLINGGVGISQGDLGCFVALPVRGLAVELPDFSISLLWELFNIQYFWLLKVIMVHRNYFLQKAPPL